MEVDKEKVRSILHFFFSKGENASQALEIVNGSYGLDAVTADRTRFWFHRFRSNFFDVKVAPRTGRQVVENFDKLGQTIKVDRDVGSSNIAKELRIDHETVSNHFTRSWIQKEARCFGAAPINRKIHHGSNFHLQSLGKTVREIDPFLKLMMTGNEKWITYMDNPVRRRSSSESEEAPQTRTSGRDGSTVHLAHFPPFLFEVFLYSTIDDKNSKCTLSDDEIIFELQKTIPQIWEKLTADISKMEMLEKRREIFEKHHQKTEEERKAKKEKMADLRRFAVQQQIERDSVNRRIIEDRRNEEKSKVVKELEEWKKNEMVQILRDANEEAGISFASDKEIFNGDSFVPNPDDGGGSNKTFRCSQDEEVQGKCTPDDLPITKSTPSQMNERDNINITNIFPIPLPRNPGTVTIHFTHRDFPTPSRESQAPQEEEWLKKQVEARRATGFVAEDLRPEECNPSWLKDKGDSFYKTGNYLGAVSAYSHAIKLGSKMASLYSNRAAAHLGLGNFHKALDDCSQALELMTPHVAANLEGRAKCHARRGAILCRLGLPEAGLADFEEALKLKPNDAKLIADIEHAKILIKNKPDEEDRCDGIEIVPS